MEDRSFSFHATGPVPANTDLLIGTQDSADPEIVRRADAAGPRVERIDHAGQTLWIKRANKAGRPVWLALQRLLALLVPLDFLRPVPPTRGAAAVAREIGMIVVLREAGFRVPEIVYASSRALVLSDLGPTLARQVVRDPGPARDEFHRGLCAAAATLARLHAVGLVHGRPSLRDFTWNGEEIGFLDFEEAPTTVMAFSPAAARDVWLLALQVHDGTRDEAATGAVMDHYAAAIRPDVREALRKVLRILLPLARLLRRPCERWGKREVRRAVGGTLALADCLDRVPATDTSAPSL
ncbi:hypothetical protein [Methylobrevis pamukkalensis]|uniref:Serine/threonine protein phosphatase n=1 Tax=Methylobrevis pamukkalensis TaxID=1439726 RepID=A0A1E3H512_9HYPH|nr:hypothetical protein [Methylobrevis pamukkalensis]ODN71427.1 hypothetical protein A6302_01204 [Methylobrevis pamukkalensis]